MSDADARAVLLVLWERACSRVPCTCFQHRGGLCVPEPVGRNQKMLQKRRKEDDDDDDERNPAEQLSSLRRRSPPPPLTH